MDIYDIEPGRHLLGYECLPGFTNRVGPDKGRLICFEINGKIQFEEDLPECIFMQEIIIGLGVGVPLVIVAIIMLILYLRLRRRNRQHEKELPHRSRESVSNESALRYIRESQLLANQISSISSAHKYSDPDREDEYSTADTKEFESESGGRLAPPDIVITSHSPQSTRSQRGLATYVPKVQSSLHDPLHQHGELCYVPTARNSQYQLSHVGHNGELIYTFKCTAGFVREDGSKNGSVSCAIQVDGSLLWTELGNKISDFPDCYIQKEIYKTSEITSHNFVTSLNHIPDEPEHEQRHSGSSGHTVTFNNTPMFDDIMDTDTKQNGNGGSYDNNTNWTFGRKTKRINSLENFAASLKDESPQQEAIHQPVSVTTDSKLVKHSNHKKVDMIKDIEATFV
ncbi:hypothetical protein EB796_009007 [Bugula neritina]|uniref:Uncharacterized protein n=1 Tax=Bugula neritina TaxID=10212 RepID=A0A7J7K509_BUGNE|nr:hypothetical protein EB796_009007 [Bugula neritina]